MDVAWKIALAIIVPNVGGAVGSFFTLKNLESWYETLDFPAYRPPNWLFAPVWTLLYVCMGFASYLVWRDGGGFTGAAQWPLIVYALQLLVNWAWSPIFFGLQSIKGGLINIAILLGLVFICGILFFRINHIAGILFVPYFLWLIFATVLNYSLYKRNA